MKYTPLLCVAVLLMTACKKDKDREEGRVYVEKTLQLDTIEFYKIYNPTRTESATMFRLRSAGARYVQTYSYELKNDAIYMQNTISSAYFGNVPQYFQWSPDRKSFSIRRFFERAGLPDTLTFVLIR